MAELTAQGYQLRTENDWFDLEVDLYLDIDASWNLDPSAPDGLKAAHDAEIFANLDELLLRAYNSKDPNKARGDELDAIAALCPGISRQQGTPSDVTLTLGGVPNTSVPAGSRVQNADRSATWATDVAATIGGGGSVNVTATCTEVGPTQAAAGEITRIVDSIAGWETVTNGSPATPGTDPESDSDFRVRRARLVQKQSSNQLDATRGEVGALDGVRRVKVVENDTNTTDADGLPPHSYAVIVDGGDSDEIALAIYLTKNPGPTLHGVGTPETKTVTSPKYPGVTKDITLSRPTYVDMTLTVNVQNDGTLPIDAADRIKQAVLDYTTSDLLPEGEGFNTRGFGIGEDVPVGAMYTPINQVIGQYGLSYVSSLDLNTQTSGTVAIAFDQLSRWTDGNILVSILDPA